jgi:Icc-related predicted phosphoesterase
MPRVVAIADLHGNLPGDLPEGDVLVIAGDVCPIDDHSVDFQDRWLRDVFADWLESLPHEDVLWIAGNHDFVCQEPDWRPTGRGRYLPDSGADAAGLSFYGTPWVPTLEGWAFYADDANLAERMAAIPVVDVLISHGPPLGFGDTLARGGQAGSQSLRARLEEVPPRVCVFGHIHEDHGHWRLGDTELANVSHVDVRYRVRPDAARVFEI